jgi:hypothetical protein
LAKTCPMSRWFWLKKWVVWLIFHDKSPRNSGRLSYKTSGMGAQIHHGTNATLRRQLEGSFTNSFPPLLIRSTHFGLHGRSPPGNKPRIPWNHHGIRVFRWINSINSPANLLVKSINYPTTIDLLKKIKTSPIIFIQWILDDQLIWPTWRRVCLCWWSELPKAELRQELGALRNRGESCG